MKLIERPSTERQQRVRQSWFHWSETHGMGEMAKHPRLAAAERAKIRPERAPCMRGRAASQRSEALQAVRQAAPRPVLIHHRRCSRRLIRWRLTTDSGSRSEQGRITTRASPGACRAIAVPILQKPEQAPGSNSRCASLSRLRPNVLVSTARVTQPEQLVSASMASWLSIWPRFQQLPQPA